MATPTRPEVSIASWLDGALRISAMEQVDFLRKLYRNELPFKVEHQRLVKDIMIVEAGRDWILRAKTGWQARVEPQIGWWVGWVETPTGAVIFALNIDLPGGMKDAPKRRRLSDRYSSRSEHFRAETCTGFSWCISPL